MKNLFAISLTSLVTYSGAAHAHVGHVGEIAGHDHWVAVAALVGAGAVALGAWIASRKNKTDQTEEETAADAQPDSASEQDA